MKYHVYGALVFAFLVSPLFLPVGCSGSVDEGDACFVETAKICSEARDEILTCTNGVWTPMACTDGTICEIRGEGPECVVDSGTGGSGGGAGTGGTGGTAGSGGTAGTGGGVECTFDTLDKQTCIEEDIYICTSTEGWQLFQDCPSGSICSESSGVFSCLPE